MNLRISWMIVGLIGMVVFLGFTGCKSTGTSEEGAMQETEIALEPVPRVKAPYEGRTIAVVAFPDKNVLSANPWLKSWLGRASRDYSVGFLLEAGFRVVEDQSGELQAVVKELEFGQTGMVDPAKAVEIGKMAGAELMFLGAVIDFSEVKTGGKRKFHIPGFNIGLGGETINYEVQTSGRIIDVKTREILASSTAGYNKQYDVGGGSLSTDYGSVGSEQETISRQESTVKIFQKALNSLTIKLVKKLNARGNDG